MGSTKCCGLFSHDQGRLSGVILEQSFLSFFFDESRCSSALFLVHVVYSDLSSSSDEHHHLSHSCLGTGMLFGTQKQILPLSCIFGSFGVRNRPSLLLVFRVEAVSRYCYFWYGLFGPSQPCQFCFLCVLVNTLQYHDTVDIVQDSETEDPHEPLRVHTRNQTVSCESQQV